MEPRIYVASLAHYNAGELVGEWFDADTVNLADVVQDYIKSLDYPGIPGQKCEEWAIHDYEGFGCIELEEDAGLDGVQCVAELLVEHGEAYAVFYSHEGAEYAAVPQFEDAYCGCYESKKDYAEAYVEDTGLLSEVPENLRYYFDYEAFARDLFIDDLYGIPGEDGLHVFRRN